MSTLKDILAGLEKKWREPRTTLPDGTNLPLALSCSFKPVLSGSRVVLTGLPPDMVEFWSLYDSARLFEDTEYGQWGLVVFSPTEAYDNSKRIMSERPTDFVETDLIAGGFLGDSDLLLVSTAPGDYGQVIIATPVDKRKDWPVVGKSFADFIYQYAENNGEKFWE